MKYLCGQGEGGVGVHGGDCERDHSSRVRHQFLHLGALRLFFLERQLDLRVGHRLPTLQLDQKLSTKLFSSRNHFNFSADVSGVGQEGEVVVGRADKVEQTAFAVDGGGCQRLLLLARSLFEDDRLHLDGVRVTLGERHKQFPVQLEFVAAVLFSQL